VATLDLIQKRTNFNFEQFSYKSKKNLLNSLLLFLSEARSTEVKVEFFPISNFSELKKSKMNFKTILLLAIAIKCAQAMPMDIRDPEASMLTDTDRTGIESIAEEEKPARCCRNDDFNHSIPGKFCFGQF